VTSTRRRPDADQDTTLVLVPSRRFDWERMIRRALIPLTVKGIALILASYADGDGRNARPGERRMIAVTGTSESTVRRALAELRRLGLVERVFQGGSVGRRGQADEYRLTLPADLLDRVPCLTPTRNTGHPRPVDSRRNTGHPRPEMRQEQRSRQCRTPVIRRPEHRSRVNYHQNKHHPIHQNSL
jgi:DNA-binding transcriptional ArsR family regulator